jgi:hypothetical protein
LKPLIDGGMKVLCRFNGSRFDASKRYVFQSFLLEVLLKRQRNHGPNIGAVRFRKQSPDVTL